MLRSTGQQPSTKSGRRSADKPLINRSAAWNKERSSSRSSTAYQSVVNRSLCSSICLHRISLVPASGETFRTCVFDALEGTGDVCLLGCSVGVPAPSSPRRALPTRPARCVTGFGFDRSVYIGFALFVLPESRQGCYVYLILRVWRTIVS